MRQQLELTDHIVIGHVGNFNYQKNHEFLIKIFKELSAKDERYILCLMEMANFARMLSKWLKSIN